MLRQKLAHLRVPIDWYLHFSYETLSPGLLDESPILRRGGLASGGFFATGFTGVFEVLLSFFPLSEGALLPTDGLLTAGAGLFSWVCSFLAGGGLAAGCFFSGFGTGVGDFSAFGAGAGACFEGSGFLRTGEGEADFRGFERAGSAGLPTLEGGGLEADIFSEETSGFVAFGWAG